VLDPGKLNHYTAFSPQVYGETSYDLIDKLLKRITLKETDTFLDLGSGKFTKNFNFYTILVHKNSFG
jgi:H3 lysine-79-specific histone-lysine N-methyltransferase